MADSAVIVLIRYQLPINFNELDIILKSYCYDLMIVRIVAWMKMVKIADSKIAVHKKADA